MEKFDPKLIRKVSAIKGAFNTEMKQSMNAYVVFKSQESVIQAIQDANGSLFEGVHIRVDAATTKPTGKDANRSVFLGNLPFKITEEELWQYFSSHLPDEGASIENIRIIRDKKLNCGKGFGYINFRDELSVPSALSLNGT